MIIVLGAGLAASFDRAGGLKSMYSFFQPARPPARSAMPNHGSLGKTAQTISQAKGQSQYGHTHGRRSLWRVGAACLQSWWTSRMARWQSIGVLAESGQNLNLLVRTAELSLTVIGFRSRTLCKIWMWPRFRDQDQLITMSQELVQDQMQNNQNLTFQLIWGILLRLTSSWLICAGYLGCEQRRKSNLWVLSRANRAKWASSMFWSDFRCRNWCVRS